MTESQDMNTVEDTQEWKNGDLCIYLGYESNQVVIGFDTDRKDAIWCKSNDGHLNLLDVEHLSKPETQQQRRYRLLSENGKAMWEDFGYLNQKTPTWDSLDPKYRQCWIDFAIKSQLSQR